MARIAAQPLEIGHLRLSALGRGDDVVALAILRHPPAGLAGVLVPALDCLDQPAPWPAASAFAPAADGLRMAIPNLRPVAHHRIPLNPSGRLPCSAGESSASGSFTYRCTSAWRWMAAAIASRASAMRSSGSELALTFLPVILVIPVDCLACSLGHLQRSINHRRLNLLALGRLPIPQITHPLPAALARLTRHPDPLPAANRRR